MNASSIRFTRHHALVRTLTPALFATLGFVSLGSFAADRVPGSPESASMRVSLVDLDLSTDAGVASARERMAKAARSLCREFRDASSPAVHETQAACQHDALVQGEKQLLALMPAGTRVAVSLVTQPAR